MSASLCVLDVDPTNAHDLLLEVWPCVAAGDVSCSAQLFRSLDGGHSWRLAAFPPTPTGSSTDSEVERFLWAWQGSTLFVIPGDTQPQPLVAVSRAAGPFVWVNQTALFAGVPADSQINTLSANAVGVFVDFESPSSAASTTPTKVSADQGASWSAFQPQYQGKRVHLVDQGVSLADSHTLVGEVVSDEDPTTSSYVTSTDGGATWAPLVATPGSLVIVGLVSTPSGAYYAELTRPNAYVTAAPGVYRLAPGASTWVLVGALPLTSVGPLTVSWDEQGQPLALWSIAWSIAQTPSTPTSSLTGLVTHTP
jgi:hypothetical protein